MSGHQVACSAWKIILYRTTFVMQGLAKWPDIYDKLWCYFRANNIFTSKRILIFRVKFARYLHN